MSNIRESEAQNLMRFSKGLMDSKTNYNKIKTFKCIFSVRNRRK